MVKSRLFCLGQFPEVDVRGKDGVAAVAKIVGETLHRCGQTPERMEKKHTGAGAPVPLDEIGKISNHAPKLPTPTLTTMGSAVAPLHHSAFRVLWAVSVLSAIGTFIQSIAASWLMLEMTGSSTWVGLMVASSTLPLLFLALFTGTLADMFDRTKIMLIAQVIMGGSALAMAVLTRSGAITPPLLLGLGLLLGTARISWCACASADGSTAPAPWEGSICHHSGSAPAT